MRRVRGKLLFDLKVSFKAGKGIVEYVCKHMNFIIARTDIQALREVVSGSDFFGTFCKQLNRKEGAARDDVAA